MSLVDDLGSICLKRKKDTRKYNHIADILKNYEKVVIEESLPPYVKEICDNPDISDSVKWCVKYLQQEHRHLWTTIAILSSTNQLAMAQNIETKLVNELCDTIIQAKYFGFDENEDLESFLEMIREAIKTYYSVMRWKE